MDNSTTHSVYRIVCFQNSKVYVGRTYDPKNRKRSHFKKLAQGKHPNRHMQNAYNKWGKRAFYFEVLESGISASEIDVRERYWITHFDSYNDGFNATPGGDIINQRNKRCTWNGIEYESIVGAASSCGVSKHVMCRWVKKGYSCNSDVPTRIPKNAKNCTWNFVTYMSLSSCAHANNVSVETMSRWIDKGYTCNNDVEAHSQTKIRNGKASKRKPVIWNNIEYSTAQAASDATGIPRTTIRRYISKGLKSMN